MPKGRQPERETSCRRCERPFRSDLVGRAAHLCHRPDCDLAGEYAREVEKQQRAEERVRARAQREAERRREKAQAKTARTKERKARKRRLEFFRPTLEDPDAMVLADDLVEIAAMAGQIWKVSKQDIQVAIVKLARAEGLEATHAAYQRLAALCLREADRTRPRAPVATPDGTTEEEE